MKTNNFVAVLAVIVAAISIAACGGGPGGPSPIPTSVPVVVAPVIIVEMLASMPDAVCGGVACPKPPVIQPDNPGGAVPHYTFSDRNLGYLRFVATPAPGSPALQNGCTFTGQVTATNGAFDRWRPPAFNRRVKTPIMPEDAGLVPLIDFPVDMGMVDGNTGPRDFTFTATVTYHCGGQDLPMTPANADVSFVF